MAALLGVRTSCPKGNVQLLRDHARQSADSLVPGALDVLTTSDGRLWPIFGV